MPSVSSSTRHNSPRRNEFANDWPTGAERSVIFALALLCLQPALATAQRIAPVAVAPYRVVPDTERIVQGRFDSRVSKKCRLRRTAWGFAGAAAAGAIAAFAFNQTPMACTAPRPSSVTDRTILSPPSLKTKYSSASASVRCTYRTPALG